MLRLSADSAPFAMRGCARGISMAIRAASRWWRSDATQDAIRQTIPDFFESCRRVVRKTHLPTRKGVMAFFGNQVLINTVAWTAGVLAASFVQRFFEVRGFRNLWGLAATRGRTLVSTDDYQAIMTLTSYSAGLVMLILMRHLILRVVAEFHSLRFERGCATGRDDQDAPSRSLPRAARSSGGSSSRLV